MYSHCDLVVADGSSGCLGGIFSFGWPTNAPPVNGLAAGGLV